MRENCCVNLNSMGMEDDSLTVCGVGNGCDALEKSLNKLDIKANRKQFGDDAILKCGNVVANVGYLRKMEFFPEHIYVYNKVKRAKSAEGIILGLSYARDAIREDMIKKDLINMASSAQDIFYDYCGLKEYLYHGGKTHYIIQTIAPYSLRYDESLSKSKDKHTMFYYTLYGKKHNNSRIDLEIKKYEDEKKKFDSLVLGHTDWKQVSKYMWKEYFENTNWKMPYEYDTVFDPMKVTDDEILMIKKQYEKPYEKTIKENIGILEQMYMNTKNKILFFLPPFSEYYKSLWNVNYYYETLELIEKLAKKCGADILDMTKEHIDDDKFRDSGHVNNEGALLMADLINNWLDI